MHWVHRTSALCVAWAVIAVNFPQAPEGRGQATKQEKSPTLACNVGHHSAQPKRQVTVSEFHRLRCLPTLEYFQALDALPQPAYGGLRKDLTWDLQTTITSKGGVTSGEESFVVAPGITLIRRYKPSDVTVIVQNAREVAIFVEGHDIHEKKCPECEIGAYIAVAPHGKRGMYKIQAMVANPVWGAAEMHFGLMNAK